MPRMRLATGLAVKLGNRVMAAPPRRAASVSTAARTPGTRKANWTNQVSSTRSRRDGPATWSGGADGADGGWSGDVRDWDWAGDWGAGAGPQNCQPGGGAGQSGGGVQPAGGTHPGTGSGHPGGGRHTMSGVLISTVWRAHANKPPY